MPILPNPENNKTDRYVVGLTSLIVTGDSQNVSLLNKGVPAILDSGAAGSSLPVDVILDIAKLLGTTVEEASQGVPCSLMNSGLNFTFGFDNQDSAIITVPFSHFLSPKTTADLAPVTDQDGNPICSLLINHAITGR